MKIFKILNKKKNLIMLAGLILVIPFTYAANQNTVTEPITNEVISSATERNSQIDLISASSTFIKIGEPIPEAKFIPIEKVRRGLVQNIDNKNNSFVIKIGDKLLHVEGTATTTIYWGDESPANFNDIDNNAKIYIFGYIKSDNSLMSATKIVIANKSKLLRK